MTLNNAGLSDIIFKEECIVHISVVVIFGTVLARQAANRMWKNCGFKFWPMSVSLTCWICLTNIFAFSVISHLRQIIHSQYHGCWCPTATFNWAWVAMDLISFARNIPVSATGGLNSSVLYSMNSHVIRVMICGKPTVDVHHASGFTEIQCIHGVKPAVSPFVMFKRHRRCYWEGLICNSTYLYNLI